MLRRLVRSGRASGGLYGQPGNVLDVGGSATVPRCLGGTRRWKRPHRGGDERPPAVGASEHRGRCVASRGRPGAHGRREPRTGPPELPGRSADAPRGGDAPERPVLPRTEPDPGRAGPAGSLPTSQAGGGQQRPDLGGQGLRCLPRRGHWHGPMVVARAARGRAAPGPGPPAGGARRVRDGRRGRRGWDRLRPGRLGRCRHRAGRWLRAPLGQPADQRSRDPTAGAASALLVHLWRSALFRAAGWLGRRACGGRYRGPAARDSHPAHRDLHRSRHPACRSHARHRVPRLPRRGVDPPPHERGR